MKNVMIAAGLLLVPVALGAQPSLNVISGEQMRINIGASAVSPAGANVWNITAPMLADNENPGLPTGFRRWWHFEVQGLDDSVAETLNIAITNAGYGDVITPVWSLDGGATYERITGVLPSVSGSSGAGNAVHQFSVTVPAGHDSVRISKFFPYTMPMFESFRAAINPHPFVEEEVIGTSVLGNNIYMYTVTDTTVPDTGKRRVWIHSAVHPSETTAHFNSEGIVNWLISGEPEADIMLQSIILNIVPMANPDGVILGNYRTNANSVNLENEWGAPYNSTVPEIVAMRTKIEEFMGTPSSPGANQIEVLLNLHSTHGGGYPYHFIHVPTYNVDGFGVIPEVRALQDTWVAALRAASPFYALKIGDPTSNLSGSSRPFAESMMHDRYTLEPQWDPVMAVTFEGTYQAGPLSGIPSTDDDYRELGAAFGPALAEFFGIDLTQTGVDAWLLRE